MNTLTRTQLLTTVFSVSLCGLGLTAGVQKLAQVTPGGGDGTMIVDDEPVSGDAFSAVNFQYSATYKTGYNGDTAFYSPKRQAPGTGVSGSATWNLKPTAAGTYEIFTTWGPDASFAKNAQYSIARTSLTPATTLAVNQTIAPAGATINKRGWKLLGTAAIGSDEGITVTVQAGTDGYTVADAILIRIKTDTPPAACGNGILEGAEQCDDGNNLPGDGCSSTCTKESASAACGDLIDNDGDGAIDMNDKGCKQSKDTNEADGPTDISVSLTLVPGPVPVDSAYDVAMTVNNLGPDTATSPVEFTANIPTGTYYEPQNSAGNCKESNGVVICRVDRLSLNIPLTMNLTFHVKKETPCATKLMHKAVVSSSPQGDPKTGNNAADGRMTIQCSAASCSDTDQGKNPDVAGTVTTNIGEQTIKKSDICEGTGVYEYYCDNNQIQSTLLPCAYGCDKGACMKNAGSACDALIPARTNTQWQNQRNDTNPLDVDDNGIVNEEDFNIVMKRLNEIGPGILPTPTPTMPPPFYNVDGKRWSTSKTDPIDRETVEPIDALLISNYLMCLKPSSMSITLSSAKLSCTNNVSQITLTYKATGIVDASLHALDAQGGLRHKQNWFSPAATVATAPLSDFQDVVAGLKVKLCHGNNYNVCSAFVTVTGAPCGTTTSSSCNVPEQLSATSPSISNGHLSAASVGGKHYFFNTLPNSYAMEYNPTTTSFTQKNFDLSSVMPAGVPQSIPTYSMDEAIGAGSIAYIFASENGHTSNILSFEPLTSTLRKVTALPFIQGGAGVWDPVQKKIYAFGGYPKGGGTPFSSVFSFDPSTVTGMETVAKMPVNMMHSAAVWDSSRNVAYVIGGSVWRVNGKVEASTAVYEFNPETKIVTLKASLPYGIARPAATYDETNDRIIVFASAPDASILEIQPGTWTITKRPKSTFSGGYPLATFDSARTTSYVLDAWNKKLYRYQVCPVLPVAPPPTSNP